MADRRTRGVAFLLVLGTLTVTMAACAAVARFAATAKALKRSAWHTRVADDLAAAAEVPMATWLASAASDIVLPPDCVVPEVAVLDERFELGATRCHVLVTAFDQCGMVPLALARGGSPLRLAIPRAMLPDIDRVPVDRIALPGLDLFAAITEDAVFPEPGRREPSIGAHIATHSPALRLNVNTAPMVLVVAALRSLGRGGSEAIEAARRERRVSTVDAATNARDGLRPSAVSNAWAFRADAIVGDLRRSWWVVFTKQSQSWQCQQRLVITQ